MIFFIEFIIFNWIKTMKVDEVKDEYDTNVKRGIYKVMLLSTETCLVLFLYDAKQIKLLI
jgi:hypothetical protein